LNKYLVLPEPAIYPEAVLDSLSQYLQKPNGARRSAAEIRRQTTADQLETLI